MNELLRQALGIVPKVSRISAEVLVSHIDRDDEVRAAWLALVSGRPAFFLGSPGVDKTGTVQAIASRIAGAVFYDELMPTVVSVEQLLVESTSIEEVPLPNGGKAIQTRDRLGKAANAHLVFADEIWKSEPRVLNILLDLARGGEVRHEGRVVKTPLLAFLAASNELPDPEGNLGALWSRMTIRLVTQPLNRAGKFHRTSSTSSWTSTRNWLTNRPRTSHGCGRTTADSAGYSTFCRHTPCWKVGLGSKKPIWR
ncbi:MAG: hypothetical protein UV70_C0009G0010 [Parcubacteria group bacterium GW2011_GWA2_43_13]|nr:MAG: hypothetical protein UV70_C0009G0010 [Parcubacteria group bacterium GW2011_GWA2_43_13]